MVVTPEAPGGVVMAFVVMAFVVVVVVAGRDQDAAIDGLSVGVDYLDVGEQPVERRPLAELDALRLAQARRHLVDRTATALAELVDEELPESLVNGELQERARALVDRLQGQGITLEQWLQVTGQDPATFTEALRAEATNAVKVDLALRAVAEAEGLDVSEADLEGEYARIAARVNQKPAKVRQAYERGDAVGGLRVEMRKRAALDWLLAHVEIVDPDGKPVDRGILVSAGHAHDDHDGHDHDDHDHDDHDGHDHDLGADSHGHDHAGGPTDEETHA